MSKVSVIVPVYNTETYLYTCLTSLVNQSLEDIEIIAIDDASEDNSMDILRAFKKSYPEKIKILQNEHNRGLSYTRNLGMSIASGEYITFVDSDDYVNPNMYQDMYDGATTNNYPEVIITGLITVKDDRNLNRDFSHSARRKGTKINNANLTLLDLMSESPSCCNKLFRKDTLATAEFIDGIIWEDYPFSYTQILNANTILRFNNADYFYRAGVGTGIMASGKKVNSHLLDCFIGADYIEEKTKESGRYERFSEEIKFLQVSLCLQRVTEILKWNIKEDTKKKLCYLMIALSNQKYGDWQDVDLNFLSTKISVVEMDKLREISAEYSNYETSSFEEDIQKELQTLIPSQTIEKRR